jgi:2-keto-4-pentenoate hydratase/2-oxohepta-3-ene-1,7-dioic acid hydratase in catechol pathway
MKIVSYRTGTTESYGALTADGIVDLPASDPGLPAALNDALARLVAYELPAGHVAPVGLDTVTLLPVVPHPEKIICIGVNYADHAAETGSVTPPYPTVFAKFANTLIADGEPILLPTASDSVDYEGELAVIIGRDAKNVKAADALDYVAGYSALDDVSARDFQGHTSQWTMGKSPDTFAPVGLAMATADEVPDPQALTLRTTVSGEVLQEASTGDMIFSVRELIAYLSQVMTLRPGDIIATGTPAGVGMARDPKRFLRAGDTVTVTIDGVAELTNPVIAEQ